MKINIVGTYFGSSGYASNTKQLSFSLHELGHEVRVDCNKPHGWEMLVNDVELLMLTRKLESDYVTIYIGQPPFLPIVMSENTKTVIPYVVWEGNKIPKYYLEYLLDPKIKQIWCPSQHVKKAILYYPEAQKLKNKIKIVPHGVNLNIFSVKEPQTDQPFKFLACKGWSQGINDRGGIQWIIKAFHEEFTVKDNVQLFVKINTAYGMIDPNAEINKLGITKTNTSPQIMISLNDVEYKTMNNFYDGDVFVTAAMAEGFNIPCLESMACGIPVITTNYGGQTDYINSRNGWFVNGTMFEVTHDKMYEGIKWMQPDLKQLRNAMRYCYEHREEVKTKGLQALKTAQKMTWTNSAKIAQSFLKEL